MVGSSPQARGTRLDVRVPAADGRFIPAGAGNTCCKSESVNCNAVHPRRRGEHCSYISCGVMPSGSSPQARGTHVADGGLAALERFIPAGAGNTAARAQACRRPPVHPRRRGEHTFTVKIGAHLFGSSPQARGTRLPRSFSRCVCRFIPAGAGNTPINRSAGAGQVGSSPQARGTRYRRPAIPARCGFIPAGAGNTAPRRSPCTGRAVHPRRRGEHSGISKYPRYPLGSSPQARGTLAFIAREFGAYRFIPAGAGNTRRSSQRCITVAVHPRRRGEHRVSPRTFLGRAGSSPQARGTPSH